MNNSEAARLARTLMNQYLSKDWHFKFNRKKQVLGECDHKNKTIYLSTEYVKHAKEAQVRQTILHEIAHAMLDSGHGHDELWRNLFISIGGDGAQRRKAKIDFRYVGACDCVTDNEWAAHRMGKIKVTGTCPSCDSHVTWKDTVTGETRRKGILVSA